MNYLIVKANKGRTYRVTFADGCVVKVEAQLPSTGRYRSIWTDPADQSVTAACAMRAAYAKQDQYKTDYSNLQTDLRAIELKLHVPGRPIPYLADELIDRENIMSAHKETDPDFYMHLYAAAGSAAGVRAEEMGLNINEMLGYVVY